MSVHDSSIGRSMIDRRSDCPRYEYEYYCDIGKPFPKEKGEWGKDPGSAANYTREAFFLEIVRFSAILRDPVLFTLTMLTMKGTLRSLLIYHPTEMMHLIGCILRTLRTLIHSQLCNDAMIALFATSIALHRRFSIIIIIIIFRMTRFTSLPCVYCLATLSQNSLGLAVATRSALQPTLPLPAHLPTLIST